MEKCCARDRREVFWVKKRRHVVWSFTSVETRAFRKAKSIRRPYSRLFRWSCQGFSASWATWHHHFLDMLREFIERGYIVIMVKFFMGILRCACRSNWRCTMQLTKTFANNALVLTRAPCHGVLELPSERAEGSCQISLELISLTRNEGKPQGDAEPGRKAA